MVCFVGLFGAALGFEFGFGVFCDLVLGWVCV